MRNSGSWGEAGWFLRYTGQCGKFVQRPWTISRRMLHRLVEHGGCSPYKELWILAEVETFFWFDHFHCLAQAKPHHILCLTGRPTLGLTHPKSDSFLQPSSSRIRVIPPLPKTTEVLKHGELRQLMLPCSINCNSVFSVASFPWPQPVLPFSKKCLKLNTHGPQWTATMHT